MQHFDFTEQQRRKTFEMKSKLKNAKYMYSVITCFYYNNVMSNTKA